MGKNDPVPPKKFCIAFHLLDDESGLLLTGRVITDGPVPHDDIALGGIQWCDFTEAMFNANAYVDGYEAGWQPISQAIDQHVYFRLKKIPVPVDEPWNTIEDADLLSIKGSFGTFFIDDMPYHPRGFCYTPPYLHYLVKEEDKKWMKVIRDENKARGYTHFILNPCNGESYNNIWPAMDLSAGVRIDAIKELWREGLIPIINIINDNKGEHIVQDDIKELLPYIRLAFVKWEMNEANDFETYASALDIVNAMNAVRHDCHVFIHMGPHYYGAPIGSDRVWFNSANPVDISRTQDSVHNRYFGEDSGNGAFWTWAKSVGIAGLFAQCPTDLDYNADTEYYNSFTRRFGMGINGYPAGMMLIDMEHSIAKSFKDGTYNSQPVFSEAEALNYSKRLREYPYEGKKLDGYMNG